MRHYFRSVGRRLDMGGTDQSPQLEITPLHRHKGKSHPCRQDIYRRRGWRREKVPSSGIIVRALAIQLSSYLAYEKRIAFGAPMDYLQQTSLQARAGGRLRKQANLLFIQSLELDTLELLLPNEREFEQASAHFEAALTLCRNGGYRPELAWTRFDYASHWHTQGDREQSFALLNEAGIISAELGMRPLNEKVLELKERVESLRASAPAYPDGLTEREGEVLRLVAAGRTDREIADKLFISIRTASTHVRNILNKTDSADRAEAATYASRHDLV